MKLLRGVLLFFDFAAHEPDADEVPHDAIGKQKGENQGKYDDEPNNIIRQFG